MMLFVPGLRTAPFQTQMRSRQSARTPMSFPLTFSEVVAWRSREELLLAASYRRGSTGSREVSRPRARVRRGPRGRESAGRAKDRQTTGCVRLSERELSAGREYPQNLNLLCAMLLAVLLSISRTRFLIRMASDHQSFYLHYQELTVPGCLFSHYK